MILFQCPFHILDFATQMNNENSLIQNLTFNFLKCFLLGKKNVILDSNNHLWNLLLNMKKNIKMKKLFHWMKKPNKNKQNKCTKKNYLMILISYIHICNRQLVNIMMMYFMVTILRIPLIDNYG